MEIITPNKFASLSDVKFSEVVSEEDFKKTSNFDKTTIVSTSVVNSKKFVWYISNKIILKNNIIIYCQTEVVHHLFKVLKKHKNLKNITLITGQSDKSINVFLYLKKPKCITKWYATNTKYINNNIVTIPIGINNSYMINYPIENDFNSLQFKETKDKSEKIYLNFNINTRFLHRFHLQRKFNGKKNYVIEKNVLNKNDYLNNLNKHKYILCPWGNGYDTHRVWEALYSNSIPISKYHKSFKQFRELPIIYLKNFKKFELQYKDVEFDLSGTKADFDYWRKVIALQKVGYEQNKENNLNLTKDNEKFLRRFNFLRYFKQRYKLLKYFLFRVYKYLLTSVV